MRANKQGSLYGTCFLSGPRLFTSSSSRPRPSPRCIPAQPQFIQQSQSTFIYIFYLPLTVSLYSSLNSSSCILFSLPLLCPFLIRHPSSLPSPHPYPTSSQSLSLSLVHQPHSLSLLPLSFHSSPPSLLFATFHLHSTQNFILSAPLF